MMGITNTELLLIDHLVKKGRIYHIDILGFNTTYCVVFLCVYFFFCSVYPILRSSSMNNALFVLTF